ncbi:MAG TPA: hypothetical protein VM889_07520 [Candidatus Thermoplasmatota archaeon]|nr:hypothetical protein [Candidatus Thermoplasmatota archaeon]
MILSPTCVLCSTAIDVITFHAVTKTPAEAPALPARAPVTCPGCGEAQPLSSATRWIPAPE